MNLRLVELIYTSDPITMFKEKILNYTRRILQSNLAYYGAWAYKGGVAILWGKSQGKKVILWITISLVS